MAEDVGSGLSQACLFDSGSSMESDVTKDRDRCRCHEVVSLPFSSSSHVRLDVHTQRAGPNDCL